MECTFKVIRSNLRRNINTRIRIFFSLLYIDSNEKCLLCIHIHDWSNIDGRSHKEKSQKFPLEIMKNLTISRKLWCLIIHLNKLKTFSYRRLPTIFVHKFSSNQFTVLCDKRKCGLWLVASNNVTLRK